MAFEGVPMSKSHSHIFQNLFDKMHEIPVGEPTHVNISNLTENQIDRVLTSVPPSGLVNLSNSVGVVSTPMDMYAKGLSDHAGVFGVVESEPPNLTSPLESTPKGAKKTNSKKHENPDFQQVPVKGKIRV